MNEFAKKPAVIVYADPLLAPSMTFVKAQASALQRFDPVYVGARRLKENSLMLPAERTVVINESGSSLGKLCEIPYKVFGWDPVFADRITNFHPVLLHAHFGPAALTAMPIARRLNIPLLCTFHGYDATIDPAYAGDFHYTFRSYNKNKPKLQHGGTLFIAVSEFIRQQLLAQGFPEEKIVQHYIGVDTGLFTPDATQREPIVLFVARLTEKKGCEFLIRAMAGVQAQMPNVELVIIGDGPLRSILEQQARKDLKLFRFLGVQPSEVIRDWMKRARVFCVPSIRAVNGDSEGFGIVFIESQATELPVASFRSGGVPEAVSHGETGLLAQEGDWQELGLHLRRLLTDQELWNRMSKAGRERVVRKFDLGKQTEKLEAIYDQVLRQSSAQTSTLHAEVMA